MNIQPKGHYISDASKVKIILNDNTVFKEEQVTLIRNTNSDERDLLMYNTVGSGINKCFYKYSDDLGEYNKIILRDIGNKHVTSISVFAGESECYVISDINITGNLILVISVFSGSDGDPIVSLHTDNPGSHIDQISGVLSYMPEYGLIDSNTSKALFRKVPEVYTAGFIVGSDGSIRNIGTVTR